jgi:hypothetical protein
MQPSFSRSRKWRIGFSVTIALFSAFALVVMANYLAARHPFRYNWSNSASSKLSPLTTRLLEGLTNNVKVIVFFKGREPLFSSVTALLKDYQTVTRRLEVEYVDYRVPGRANFVASQYKLSGATESSQVIFDCNGNVRSVAAAELSDFDVGDDRQIHRSKFKGEQLFTSALLSVTSQHKPKTYFLTGHGENDPESMDDLYGYVRFSKLLQNANVEVATLNSLHYRDVPDDCSLLIIAGPSSHFLPEELERLNRYLTQGGRTFVIFPFLNPGRPPTGLENFLATWNVEVGMDVVIDQAESQANNQTVVIASHYGAHPVTKPLLRSKIGLIAPRMIASRPSGSRADAPKTTELIFTSEGGAAHGGINSTGVWTQLDRSGSVPLAVAVEKGGIQGVAVDRGATRIIVASTAVSFGNAAIEQNNNADFVQLAVHWLLSRDVLLGAIPPRAVSDFQLTVTDHQMKVLQWIFLAAAPGAALLVGVMVWLKRRV